MARARDGLFGKAVDERMNFGAAFSKVPHAKHLHTSALTQRLSMGPAQLISSSFHIPDHRTPSTNLDPGAVAAQPPPAPRPPPPPLRS
jgi:hypothetical protein